MRRICAAAIVVVAVGALAVVVAPAAGAAAPGVAPISASTLTTNGRTSAATHGMNGESFQQDGITSYRGWQYTAFWDEQGHVNLSRRSLPSGAWQNLRFADYTTHTRDSHNTISIGIAHADGTIHLAFDTHHSPLRYRRSVPGLATNPRAAVWQVSSFGAVTANLAGEPLNVTTYPAFVSAPDGSLQLSLRTGGSGSGDQRLWEYAGGRWRGLGTFVSGVARGNNPYFFGLEYGADGLLLGTWTVRETPDPSTNHDLYFAYSKDRGRTWRNNTGVVVGTTGSAPMASDLPALKVWSIPSNRGLINAESMTVDGAGVVHVLASHLPADAPSTGNYGSARDAAVLVHYYRDKATSIWHRTFTPFREGTSRGDIGVDCADNLYVVSGDSAGGRLHIETASKASNWTDWTLRRTSPAGYYSDPLVDQAYLRSGNRLSIFAPLVGGSRIDVQTRRTTSLSACGRG